MSADSVPIATYVPEEQKTIWEAEADDLEMTLSEFIRTMVQAGRRDLPIPGQTPPEPKEDPPHQSEDRSYEAEVVDILEAHGSLDWDELLELLADDVEARLEDAIAALEDESRIRYKPRDGGYVLRDDE